MVSPLVTRTSIALRSLEDSLIVSVDERNEKRSSFSSLLGVWGDSERPLDYEIGRPRTMAKRKDRFQGKLDQAKSMRSFIESNPSGTNYDFSNVCCIEYAVVSPFVEWIWSRDNELWIEVDLPRILSPEEVFTLLDSDP